jgi:hypothetical protein
VAGALSFGEVSESRSFCGTDEKNDEIAAPAYGGLAMTMGTSDGGN